MIEIIHPRSTTVASPAIPLSPDRTSRACGVAAEKPRSHPLEFYLWVSFEGAGVR
jgi:hypothetical protein